MLTCDSLTYLYKIQSFEKRYYSAKNRSGKIVIYGFYLNNYGVM